MMAESMSPTGHSKQSLSTNIDSAESIHEKHVDAYEEAQRLAAQHEADHYDTRAETRLVRKIDLRLMPLVSFALCFFEIPD